MLKLPNNSWVWLLALYTAASLVETLFWSQVNAFTPLYLPRLGVAREDVTAWTGALVSISSTIGIPLLPLWGALADRYTRKPVIVRSFLAHLVAGVICVLAPNVWLFLVGRTVMSFALGNSGLMMTTLSERVPRARVGFAYSLFNGAAPVGAFVGPLLGGPIVDGFGFPALLALDAVLMAIVIGVLWLGYDDAYRASSSESVLSMAVGSLGIIWRSPRLRGLFPALFILFSGWILAFVYVPLVVTSLYRGPDPGTVVGVVIGTGGLSALVLSPALGALADRYGHWRVLYAGGALATVLWPLPALTTDLAVFTVLFALLNGVVSAVFALSFTVLASSTEERTRGRVMSFAYLPANLGFAVGPAIGTAVARFGLTLVFPIAAVLTALGVGALYLAERRGPPAVAVASTA
ncbi:MAG TPA: MFS transporter [Candidatus Limnocylindria bacterium]|nr:MFS transporter [Candidatus Limnocylindria bacterium]